MHMVHMVFSVLSRQWVALASFLGMEEEEEGYECLLLQLLFDLWTDRQHTWLCSLIPRPHPRGEGLVTSGWFLGLEVSICAWCCCNYGEILCMRPPLTWLLNLRNCFPWKFASDWSAKKIFPLKIFAIYGMLYQYNNLLMLLTTCFLLSQLLHCELLHLLLLRT